MTSSQPTTAALLTLLPSYNVNTIPTRLTSAAASLLAQSRQRAANLKPEEEIARAYACAEIAVDRLREPLRLPPKKSGSSRTSTPNRGGGPPCKPAVYRKLLGFLVGVLEREVVTPQSVNKRKRDAVAEQRDAEGDEMDVNVEGDDEEEDDEIATPSKKRARLSTAATPTKARTPATSKKTPRSTVSSFAGRISNDNGNASGAEAPALVMPAIRKLTKHYSTEPMAPHVYTGVCIVLKLAAESEADEEAASSNTDISTTALLVALYLMVLTKMQRGQLKTKTFNSICAKTVDMFGGKGKATAGTDTSPDLEQATISDWIRKINREGWCKGQPWWESVPDGTLAVGVDGMGSDADVAKGQQADPFADDDEDANVPGVGRRRLDLNLDQDDPDGVLLPGLGTMMQESLDWNSDEKRRAFEAWKKGFLRKLNGAAGTINAPTSGKKKATPAKKAASTTAGDGNRKRTKPVAIH